MEEEIRKLRFLISGDERTVRQIHDAFFPLMAKHILKNGGDMDLVKEVVNDSILVLIRKAQKPGFELTAKITTYLYSVGAKLFLKKLRDRGRKNRGVEYVDPTEELGVTTDEIEVLVEPEENPRNDGLQKAIAQLDEICREILLKTILGNVPHEEIAELFEYAVDYVKVKKKRCKDKLLNIIKENS